MTNKATANLRDIGTIATIVLVFAILLKFSLKDDSIKIAPARASAAIVDTNQSGLHSISQDAEDFKKESANPADTFQEALAESDSEAGDSADVLELSWVTEAASDALSSSTSGVSKSVDQSSNRITGASGSQSSSGLALAGSSGTSSSGSDLTSGFGSSLTGGSGTGVSDSGSTSSGSDISSTTTTPSDGGNTSGDANGNPTPGGGFGTSVDMNNLLLNLKPLPKVHYSWGLVYQFGDYEERVLYELARITHSLSVAGEWTNEEQIDKCVSICARINATEPNIPCKIGVNYSPWHRKFGKDLPPTDRGPTYWDEINYFAERMQAVKGWVKLKNDYYKSNVEVGALLLDCERFYVKPDDEAWNKGMQEALDAITKKAQEIFPNARIEWYGRGVTLQDGKWVSSGLFTGKEIIPALSCSLYRLPEEEYVRQIFEQTCAFADKMNVTEVTPWVALASGHKLNAMKKFVWVDDWDYDLMYSYRIGEDLNKTASDSLYSRAKVVVFFPAPFCRESPAWGKHFVAYVRGATGVEDLSDLGYK